MTSLLQNLNQIRITSRERFSTAESWKFPVQGYGIRAIGGKNGNGYLPSGYRFLDGNNHGGHPAHDIFINDRDQDGFEDRSGKPVCVLSVLSGIVVAMETQWDTDSRLRGGKYVMVFHPGKNLVSYYAHLAEINIQLGAKVVAGQPLGTIGRTGLNAYKKRSPTHLHIMVLEVDSIKGLIPINPFQFWGSR